MRHQAWLLHKKSQKVSYIVEACSAKTVLCIHHHVSAGMRSWYIDDFLFWKEYAVQLQIPHIYEITTIEGNFCRMEVQLLMHPSWRLLFLRSLHWKHSREQWTGGTSCFSWHDLVSFHHYKTFHNQDFNSWLSGSERVLGYILHFRSRTNSESSERSELETQTSKSPGTNRKVCNLKKKIPVWFWIFWRWLLW